MGALNSLSERFEIGDRSWDFLRGLQWIALSAFVTRLLTGTATVLVARWMGPAGFGEVNLALAVTFWIQVPLFSGIPTSLMHYLPGKSFEERGIWEATGLWLLCATICVTLALSYVFRNVWSHLVGVNISIFNMSLLWSAGFALYFPATSLLNARESYKSRALAEVILAIIFALSIIALRATGHVTALTYIITLALGYGVTGAIILTRMRSTFSHFFVRSEIFKALGIYSVIATFGSLSSALFNSPARLIAARHLSLPEIGLLSAYQGGSIQMAAFFIGISSQVFFPIASRTPDKQKLMKKLTRVVLLFGPLTCLLFGVLLELYFLVLGKHYPITLKTLIIFVFAAYVALWYGLLTWFLASLGRRGVLISVIIGMFSGILNLLLCLFLVPDLHIQGAGLAYVVSSSIGIAACYLPYVRRVVVQKSLRECPI